MDILINTDLSGKLIQFLNCYIVEGDQLVKKDLWVRDGFFKDGLKLFYSEKVVADIVIDVGLNIISPGLIDIQINGAYGHDFSNVDYDIEEICDKIAAILPTTGVTGFYPTIITSPPGSYAKLIPQFQKYKNKNSCAKLLGIHLEGPFISKQSAGMHPVDYIIDFGPDPIKTIHDTYGQDLHLIKMVTIAPELKGSDIAISYLISKNIIISMGHTNAEYETVKKAISNGVSFVTHMFNAMPAFHHRKDHLFGSISISKPPLNVGLIADLVHVSPAALCLAEAISHGQVVLVTDSNTAFGLPDGMYTFGVQSIEVVDGMTFVAGTKCLAGSNTTLLNCVRNFWTEVTRNNSNDDSLPLELNGLGRALVAATSRPALVHKLYRHCAKNHEAKLDNGRVLEMGSLTPESYADFIIIKTIHSSHVEDHKPELKVLFTWIDGKPVYIGKDHENNIQIKHLS